MRVVTTINPGWCAEFSTWYLEFSFQIYHIVIWDKDEIIIHHMTTLN